MADMNYPDIYRQDFILRLRELRNARNISAREMSLALGQNVNYINLIENGKRLPSMQGFFQICEYLTIPPSEFFENTDISFTTDSSENTVIRNEKLENLISDIKNLGTTELPVVSRMIHALV